MGCVFGGLSRKGDDASVPDLAGIRWHQLPGGPCCLVLDARLPGMSGLEVQQKLIEAGKHVPIVFITSHGDIPMTVKAMKSGAVEFLTKPFRDQDFIDAIQDALKRDSDARLQENEIAELIQRQHILRVLERTGGVISGPNGAGAILNVHPNTLRSLMNRLGIRHRALPHSQVGREFSKPVLRPGRVYSNTKMFTL